MKSEMHEPLQITIGFLGAGQMARALAAGMVQARLATAGQIVAYDPVEAARQQFGSQIPGARFVADNRQVIAAADVVFVAVKPQQIDKLAAEVKGALAPDKLLVSIAAGIAIAKLTTAFGTDRVVRVMPNTPSLVGQGAAAYSLASGASPQDAAVVRRLLDAVGLSLQVDEPLLDAVTGLSGSGPAFVYVMIEALSDGGVRMGLPRAAATALAAQTVLGAARMVLATGEHPGVLKDRVASPGGTTIAGLQTLEDRGLRAALIAAVEAAAKRSAELGKPK